MILTWPAVNKKKKYSVNQKEYYNKNRFQDEEKAFLKKYEVTYDER